MNVNERVREYFDNLMPQLLGQSLLVEEYVKKKGIILREGEVTGFDGSSFQVHLLAGTFYFKGHGKTVRSKKDITLEPYQFFDAYDKYIFWLTDQSSLDEKSKQFIERKAREIHQGYRRCLGKQKFEIWRREWNAWEMPQKLASSKRNVNFIDSTF